MKVRTARYDDADAIARLHIKAFDGEIGPLAGMGYMRPFMCWFIKTPGTISLVAEEDGAVVGYIFGAPDGYGPPLTRKLVPEIALGVLRNLPRIVMHPSFRRQVRSRLTNLLLRREPSSPIFDATPSGCFCLVGIGTDQKQRGRGVGTALVNEFCTRVGAFPILLDVFADNGAARALYERSGFRELVQQGRVIRMIRPQAAT